MNRYVCSVVNMRSDALVLLETRRHRCAGQVWVLDPIRRGHGHFAFSGPRASHFGGPPLGDVPSLVTRLGEELWRLRRRRSLTWVRLMPSVDAFVEAGRDLRDPCLAFARTLLARGVGVVLETRGSRVNAEGLVTLARCHPGLVRVHVGFFSAQPELRRDWEHGAASLEARLRLASALVGVGADVVGHLGPIIPMLNDEPAPVDALFDALALHRVRTVVPSWIEDAPGLVQQVEREVSRSRARMLHGWFHMEGARQHMGPRRIPEHVRRRGLGNLHPVADEKGLQLVVCRCATERGTASCLEGPRASTRKKQLDLFAKVG